MLQYLFYAFLIYLAYRLVFNFIIPVYKTSKQVKKQFHEMKDRMEEHMKQQQAGQQDTIPQPETKKDQAGDYIDFEEVK